MRLSRRVKSLERLSRRGGKPCALCKGEGWPAHLIQGHWPMQPSERVIGCPSCGGVSGFKVVVLDPQAPDPVAAWERQLVLGRPTLMRFEKPRPSELERLADLLMTRSG